jgi:hypothetical protein
VVKTGQITKVDRTHAWNELQHAAIQKKTRPFFRAVDRNGRMYAGNPPDTNTHTHTHTHTLQMLNYPCRFKLGAYVVNC